MDKDELDLLDGRYVGFKQYNKDRERHQEEHMDFVKNQTALMTKMNLMLWVGGVIAAALIGVLVQMITAV